MLRKPCWHAIPDPLSPRTPAANARMDARSHARPPSPFDEYDEEMDLHGLGRSSPKTRTGMIAFILSLVPLGLLLVTGILWYALSVENRQQENAERTRIMVYWFAVLDIASFVTAVSATVLAARGLSPTTSLYPGWSTTALILGISEVVITAIVGFFLFCCVGFLEIVRNGG